MYKRLLVIFAFVFLLATPVAALEIVPPIGVPNPSAIFGQDHAYTVTFRGNGEAIVNMRVAFTNATDQEQSKLEYRIPRVEPQDLMVYQVIREPQCIEYADNQIMTQGKKLPDSLVPSVVAEPLCMQYDTPNYYDTYWYGTTSYLKADVAYEGDTITVTLPNSVSPNESGSILLYYRANGYTSKGSLDVFSYTFESLKSAETIRNLTVGITTDSGMKLKNPDSDVNYRFEEFDSAVGMMEQSKMTVSNSSVFDNYYQQIGQGRVVKYATYLQPLDSFTVEGAYADATWKLHAKAIMIGIVVVVGILAVLAFGITQLIKFIRGNKNASVQQPAMGHSVLFMGMASFIASLFIAGYTVVVYVLSSFIDNWYYSEMNMLLILLVVIVSFGIYPLLLFGPALLIGRMRGMRWGVGTFTLTLIWLMIYVFILAGYMMVANGRNDSYYGGPEIMPMMQTETQDF